MYEKVFESTKLVTPDGSYDAWRHLFYLPAWDAFMAVGNSEYARVFRDGTKARFGVRSGGYEPLGRVRGVPAWWKPWTKRLHPAFEINGLPDDNQVLNPAWEVEYGVGPSATRQAFVDEAARLYLHQATMNRIDVYDLGVGQVLYQITHNAGAWFTSVAWADAGQVACLVKSTGAVRIIDYLRGRVVVEAGRVDPFAVGAYDCRHHNFVTLGADRKVRVYCRETLPANLSAPQFEQAQVRALKANAVRARLTGQDGEPCAGWWVHWELLGVGQGAALGYLDRNVSKTDEDGWAGNLYYGPDDGATGQSRLRVRVVY
uniref:Uncharacterized protein n=1 Tax=Desulfobacca acetoxidans TaxID=60893 RepID=A0A7C3YZY7_9BACT